MNVWEGLRSASSRVIMTLHRGELGEFGCIPQQDRYFYQIVVLVAFLALRCAVVWLRGRERELQSGLLHIRFKNNE